MVPIESQKLTRWLLWSYRSISGPVEEGLSRNNTPKWDTLCRIDTATRLSRLRYRLPGQERFARGAILQN